MSLALGRVKGTVNHTELENEDVAVVYSVEITHDKKGKTEVKVDAVTGNIVKVEKSDASENENKHQE
ncbi:PepSY domain-containing protein [Paenibacillus uliginis]|uniref:PepSY domain-containing protein n=1 Tax=Paenibacillus uliginis TaxID=683737 RepID=UPI001FCDB231|nr:PepSY domain-containing protein [Paenibacillus uliginis]